MDRSALTGLESTDHEGPRPRDQVLLEFPFGPSVQAKAAVRRVNDKE